MKRREYIRNLKDTRIVITLENIPYDILIHTNRQRSAVTIRLYTLPARGSHTARDWEIQMTIKSFYETITVRTQAIYGSGGSKVSPTTESKVKWYLIHALDILHRAFCTRKHRFSWSGSSVEYHRVKVGATGTISSPTSISVLSHECQVKILRNTSQCSLGLFELDISRVCPSLSYLTHPCYRHLELLKLS